MPEQAAGSPGTAGQAFRDAGVSTHDHFEALLEAQQQFVAQGFALRDRETTLARAGLDVELARLNELRRIVDRVLEACPTKDEVLAWISALEGKLRASILEARAETITAHDFRVAHEMTAKSETVAAQLVALWERVDKELQPLRDAKLIAASKADQWKANLALALGALTLMKFALDYLVPTAH